MDNFPPSVCLKERRSACVGPDSLWSCTRLCFLATLIRHRRFFFSFPCSSPAKMDRRRVYRNEKNAYIHTEMWYPVARHTHHSTPRWSAKCLGGDTEQGGPTRHCEDKGRGLEGRLIKSCFASWKWADAEPHHGGLCGEHAFTQL